MVVGSESFYPLSVSKYVWFRNINKGGGLGLILIIASRKIMQVTVSIFEH